MSYQFIHEETYGRKSGRKTASKKKQRFLKGKINISELVAEATRAPGSTPHISTPEPPTYLYGEDLNDWMQKIVALAEDGKDRAGKKLRTDRQIVSGGIASFPMRSEEYKRLDRESPERRRAEVWLKDNVSWLLEQYEDNLGPVLLHLDEEFVHIHYYVAPEVVSHKHGYELVPFHRGYRAKRQAAREGVKSGAQNHIYNETMRKFQGDYSESVGLANGLTRFGPGRRRLSRAEHHQEVVAAMHVWLARETERKHHENSFLIHSQAQEQSKIIKEKAIAEAQAKVDAIIKKAELNAERHIELVNQLAGEEAELHFANAQMDGLREGIKQGHDKGHGAGYQSGFKRGFKQGVDKGLGKLSEKRDALLLAVSDKFDPVATQLISEELDRFLNEMTHLLNGGS